MHWVGGVAGKEPEGAGRQSASVHDSKRPIGEDDTDEHCAISPTLGAQETAGMRTNAAQPSREDARIVESPPYMAKQKIALTQEVAQRKNAELTISNATAERSKLQLQARTSEANQAHQQAAMAKQSLAQKTAEANLARQQAADAQASAAQDQASLAAMQAQMDEMKAKKTPRGMVINGC